MNNRTALVATILLIGSALSGCSSGSSMSEEQTSQEDFQACKDANSILFVNLDRKVRLFSDNEPMWRANYAIDLRALAPRAGSSALRDSILKDATRIDQFGGVHEEIPSFCNSKFGNGNW